MKAEDTFDMDTTYGMASVDGRPVTWGDRIASENPNRPEVKLRRSFEKMMNGFKERAYYVRLGRSI